MFFFYTSIPFSIFQGVIAHLFNLPLNWGATRKKIEMRESIWDILYNFRLQYLVMSFYCIFVIFSLLFICSSWYGSLPIILMILGHLINPVLMSPYLFSSPEIELPV